MRLFDVPITPPARLAPPFRFRVPFYRLASHRIPVLWHLYRALLRASPDELHRQATRVRWRKPERRSSTSPAATSAALVYEHRVLSDYITCRANPASLDQISHDRIASIRSEEETQTAIMQREDEAWKEYHAALATIPSTIQPRRTPGLVMPSLQNGPLPRLKPQPLHISMLIHRRQESRDRRTVQQKAWQEMLFHLRQEASFLDQMETDAADEREMGKNVSGTIAENKRSLETAFKRLGTKFTTTVLHQRNVQRRKKPGILAEQRRREETSLELEAIWAVQKPSGDGPA